LRCAAESSLSTRSSRRWLASSSSGSVPELSAFTCAISVSTSRTRFDSRSSSPSMKSRLFCEVCTRALMWVSMKSLASRWATSRATIGS
jgi:hypothetical protein